MNNIKLWRKTHETLLNMLSLILEIRGKPHLIKNTDHFYSNETEYIDMILENINDIIVEIKNNETTIS